VSAQPTCDDVADPVSSDQVAELAGSSLDVVWKAARTGHLGATKVGRTWVFDREEAEAWAEAWIVGQRRLPAGPLLAAIERSGGRRPCGVLSHSPDDVALDRARLTGCLTPRMADRLAGRPGADQRPRPRRDPQRDGHLAGRVSRPFRAVRHVGSKFADNRPAMP
jgi:excisionase family DNA binding protein